MLRQYLAFNPIIRRHFSALYITGDKANKTCAVIEPVLDIDERLNNFDEIQENSRRRKLNINVSELSDEYNLFKSITDRKKAIKNRRDEIAEIVKQSPSEGLKIQARQLKEDLQKLKENSYHLEGNLMKNYLALPNHIHESTPDERKVVYSFKDETKIRKDKLENNSIREMIEFYDPTCYYMKGEAAKFDLFMPMQTLDYYKDNGFSDSFVKFSNPDFTRSVIPEAAGVLLKDLYLIKEEDIENKLNLLHLTGNASFLSFLPFITKLSAFPTKFPFKFICSGKQYDARNLCDHQDLYKVVQSTCCQSFYATTDGTSFDDVIDEQVEHFINTFEKFNQHFRIFYYPSHELQQAESCRIGVEMFSPSQNSYVEVGNFSYYGDYISKRLLFNYKIEKDYHFPHIYSGTVVNVMKLLLILLENVEDFKCPKWY